MKPTNCMKKTIPTARHPVSNHGVRIETIEWLAEMLETICHPVSNHGVRIETRHGLVSASAT